ncbi:metalloprotease MmpA [bacterium MnTg02]|nr:metalloprotease MmpA [bacterium MnTg02]
MDIFTNILEFGNTLFSYVLPFLFVLTIVVFFHELGHFIVARWCGVGVKVFSIGFGKEVFGFNDKKGTRWRISWVPLGGYVKFIDDENAASVPGKRQLSDVPPELRDKLFHGKTLAQRAAVVAAGPIANFILAILIFAAMFTFVGQRTTAPIADQVSPNSAAELAGFKPGDRVLSIDGQDIETFAEMQRIVSVSADRQLKFVLDRGGNQIELTATPKRREITDNFGNKIRLGLLGIRRETQAGEWNYKSYDPLTAIWLGTKETYFVIDRTLNYLYDVITGRESADQLGGPLRIAQISGQVASVGILALINLAAILSVSIGLINLFPIPMLDGGHLLFYGIEAIRGRPLSDKTQEIGFRIGLAFVLMLMVFATWNDLIHLKFL